MPQRMQLPGVDAMAGGFEPLLEQARQRQVHVVAAEQDVLADRDALERQVAVAFADRDQAEVGRAAADVADQHEIADLHAAPPAVAERVEPGVERGLRLFEQRDLLEPRGAGGAQRQLAGLLVERRGHGQQHVLLRQRQRGIALRRHPDRRPRPDVAGTRPTHRPARCAGPRRARPTAGSARSGSPRRATATTSPRRPAAPDSRRRAAARARRHESRLLVPRQREAAGGKIELARRVEERRQQRARGDFAGVHQLRDVLDPHSRRVAGGGVHPAEGAVGGAEVDADDEAMGYR